MINSHFNHAMMRNYGDVEQADLVGPFVGVHAPRQETLEMHDLSHPHLDKKRLRGAEDDQVYFTVFSEVEHEEKKPKMDCRRNSTEKFAHFDPLLSFDLSAEPETHETGRAPFLPQHPHHHHQPALESAQTECAAFIPTPSHFVEACNEFHHTSNLSDMLSLSNHPAFSEFGELVSATNAVQAEAAPSHAAPLPTKVEPVSPVSSGPLSLVHDSPPPARAPTEVGSSVKELASRLVRLGELADQDPERARAVGLLRSLEGLHADVATLTHRMDPTSPCPAKPALQGCSPSKLPVGAVGTSGVDGALPVDDDLSVRLPEGLEELWYADRPYPTFSVEVSNSGGYCPPSLKSARIQLSLLDSDMNDVSDKLGGAAALQNFCFSLSDGRTEVHGLRFLSVSSKCGGHFHLVVSLVPEDAHSVSQQAKPFVSKKIQVLSYRLFHSPKVDFEKLRPSDSISKMKGIGNLYAKRFTSLGVVSVQNLAELDVEGLHGQEQGAKLLEYLRRDRGAMTLAKLNTYVAQARDIVQRYNTSTSTSTSNAQRQ